MLFSINYKIFECMPFRMQKFNNCNKVDGNDSNVMIQTVPLV